MISSAALQYDFRGEKRGGSVPSILELAVSTGHTSSIRKVDGLHGIKGKYTLLSSSVTTALESLHSSLAKNSANERAEFPREYVPLLKSLRPRPHYAG